MLLEQPEDDDHWDGDHNGPGHQRAPVGVVLPLEAGDTDGERPVAVAAQQDAGEHVFVPTGDEGEDRGSRKPGQGEREHDSGENLKAVGSVHHGRFVDGGRDGVEIALHHPGAEGHGKGGIG